MNPMAIGLPLQIGATAVNAIRSNKFLKEAEGKLDNLIKNPITPYKANRGMLDNYSQAVGESMAPSGFSMAEVNNFLKNQASAEAASMYNANKLGAPRGIMGVLNSNMSNAYSDFQAKNEQIQESRRIGAINRAISGADKLQSIDTANVNANIRAQEGLGNAIRQQRENISRFWSSIGSAGGLLTGYGMMQGLPSAGKADGANINWMDRLSFFGSGGHSQYENLEPSSNYEFTPVNFLNLPRGSASRNTTETPTFGTPSNVSGATTPGSNWLFGMNPVQGFSNG